MNKPTDKPLNGKAPRFRQYLEEEGILDYLTVELMSLFKVGSPKGGLEMLRNKRQSNLPRKHGNIPL